MHLVNDEPHKQQAQIKANIASSSAKKGSPLVSAIKNKLAGITKKPIQAYYDRKVRKHSEGVDRDVAAIKDYRAMRDSGSSVTSTPEFRKKASEYELIKSKYSK